MPKEVRWERMFPDSIRSRIQRLSGCLFHVWALRTPRSTEHCRTRRAQGTCNRVSRGANPWRYRRASRLLAYPRTRYVRQLGISECRRSPQLAHRDASMATLQKRLLPRPRRRCPRIPHRYLPHRTLRTELAGPQDPPLSNSTALRDATLRASRF